MKLCDHYYPELANRFDSQEIIKWIEDRDLVSILMILKAIRPAYVLSNVLNFLNYYFQQPW